MKYGKLTGFKWQPPEGTCTRSFVPPPPLSAHAKTWYYRYLYTPFMTLVVFGSLALNSLLIVCCQVPALLLYPFPCLQSIYRRYIRFTKRAWVEIVHALCFCFAPTELYVTGDAFDFVDLHGEPEPVIVLANHMTFADWLYIWFLAMAYGAHGHVKIIMKEELKRIPIFGFVCYRTMGMQMFEFIFLKRSWNHDQPRLAKAFDRMAQEKRPLWLMVFPEGTLISDQTMEVNLKYAEKAGLTDIPRYQLLPRATGLEFCLRHLHPGLKAVYDITMGYEGARPQYPQDDYTLSSIFVHRRPPPRIHMHIKRYAIQEFMQQVDTASELKPAPSLQQLVQDPISGQDVVPSVLFSSGTSEPETSTSSVRKRTKALEVPQAAHASQLPSRSSSPLPTSFTLWLREFFMGKDRLLHQFYSTGHFPPGQRNEPLVVKVGDRSLGLLRGAFGPELALIRLWLGALVVFQCGWYLMSVWK